MRPYIVESETLCDDCGGSGWDPGSLDWGGPEPCPSCNGSGVERARPRDYLAEAFQIVGNLDNTCRVERGHLVAIVQHCRMLVSALIVLPECKTSVVDRAEGLLNT